MITKHGYYHYTKRAYHFSGLPNLSFPSSGSATISLNIVPMAYIEIIG